MTWEYLIFAFLIALVLAGGYFALGEHGFAAQILLADSVAVAVGLFFWFIIALIVLSRLSTAFFFHHGRRDFHRPKMHPIRWHTIHT